MNNLPSVSVIIPSFNEGKFITRCLDSITSSDYPKERLEILVIDGMSNDETRELVENCMVKHKNIRLLSNPKRVVPVAFNIGIQHAKGEVIMIMSAHATCEQDYISKCVKYLYEYSADSVGGQVITLPGRDSNIGKAIAIALSNRFGVGNSTFRIGSKKPELVDTVPYGCYRKEVFEKIGGFNECLFRNQDIELNLRLKRNNGRILLVPDTFSYYYARSDLRSLFRQNFSNGFWVIYSGKFAKFPFSLRHLVPFVFVLSLIGSLFLSLFFTPLFYIFAVTLGLYLGVNMFFSFSISLRKGPSLSLPLMVSFLTLHFSYGLGSVWGCVKLILPEKRINKDCSIILI